VADTRHDRVIDPRVRVLPALAGEDSDGRPACLLRPSRGRGHHLSEPTGDHGAAGFGEQAADLLGARLVFGAASDHRHLHCPHGAMVEIGAMAPISTIAPCGQCRWR